MSNEVIKETFITTKDNPYDPFKRFEEWYAFDTGKGYNTCALIDRVATTMHDESYYSNENEIEKETIDEMYNVKAIKQIVKLMPEFYTIVTNETFVESLPITIDI